MQIITKMTIENCQVKINMLSANYGPKNRVKKNYLRQKILIEKKEDE